MALQISSLKNKLAFKQTTVNLGHASRKGGEAVAKMAQYDIEGNELVGVSEQVPVLDFDKGFAKHRAAFVKGLGFCVAVPNEATDKTTTVRLPLPMKKIIDFKTPIEKIPAAIVNKGTKAEMPDFELVKHDEAGKVTAKAVEVDGNWVLEKYNVPVFKQRYNPYGEPISQMTNKGEERKGIMADEDGFYLEVTSPYTYCALSSLTIVPGYAVSASGTKIKDSDGLYLLQGAVEDSSFQKVDASGSAGKFSIKSLMKVITHPTFGIANSSDVVGGLLKRGSAKIDTTPQTIHVYNSDNVVDAVFSKEVSDRKAFKLNTFKAKAVS